MDIPTDNTARIEFPEAALAGYLSAEIQQLHGVHPEIVYDAIIRARRTMNVAIYIGGPTEATAGQIEPNG